jgi:trk system potassium uptake protein TrkH
MTEESVKGLMYAVRGRVVLKYCGQLALILAILTLAPLALALFEADWVLAARYAIVCCLLLAIGGLFARLPAPNFIRVNEALTVTVLAFVIPALLMVWPMMASKLPAMDALFEAVSGVTTTGLTTLGNVDKYTHSFLFLRAWMQWYGGLGFVVLSVALLMGHQATARRLISPVESGEPLMVTARTHARRSLIVYVSLTLAGFALVWALSGNGFASLLHVLSSVSTGGFSSFDNSLSGFSSRPAAIAVIALSAFSAVSLPLYWKAFHTGWRKGLRNFITDVELRLLLLACLLAGAILSGLGWLHGSDAPWYHGLMLGFSAQTTTGFTTQVISDMDPASKVVMMISMLIGGSVGSSAGGFKLLRLLILLRMLQWMLRRAAMPPHAVATPYLGEQKLEADDINRALQLVLLFVILVILSWVPFVMLGYDPLDALFEVVSACGTVGLSSGIARPELESLLKGILCFDMLAGRVEIVALLVVLYPRNWFGRREEKQ